MTMFAVNSWQTVDDVAKIYALVYQMPKESYQIFMLKFFEER